MHFREDSVEDSVGSTKIEINKDNQISMEINEKLVKSPIYGYKAVVDTSGNKCLLEIKLLEDSKVASAVSEPTKFRTNRALVTKLWNFKIDGSVVKLIPSIESTAVSCVYTKENSILYKLDEIITVENFNEDLGKVCVPGIHFCMNAKDALKFHNIN